MNPTNVAAWGADPKPETATSYPIGYVDFNKPFEVVDAADNNVRHSNARVLTILEGNNFPVVIISTEGGEEVVNQFDTDGDSINGELKVENMDANKAFYGALVKYGSDHYFYGPYRSFNEAKEGINVAHGEVIVSIFRTDPVADPAAEQSDLRHDGDVIVNGDVYKPGDKVTVYRPRFGERQATVIKTRNNDRSSLYVQADFDGSKPYWALNKNVRGHNILSFNTPY